MPLVAESSNTLYIALGICAFFAAVDYVVYRRNPGKLPPGPKGLPLVGNLLDMPGFGDPLPWIDHRELYGPISCVQVLGKTVVLLNDLQTSVDLLDKKSSIYSGRPIFPFAGTMVGWDQQLIMAQYGDHFKTMRRLLKSYISSPSAAKTFQHVQEVETRWLLHRILENPSGAVSDIRLAAGSISLQISHGYKIETEKPDPLVNLVETAAKEFYRATMPGTWLVDIFPILRYVPSWVPGARFKKVAAEYRIHNFEQSDRPYDFVKRRMEKGMAMPSFTASVLSQTPDAKTEYAAKFAATGIYGGGSDPAVGSLSAFLLLMILHPECQRRAQLEIDSVVGPRRFPNFNDRQSLPYTQALIKEVLRWHTVGRIGIPHRLMQDDYYNGYFIPKDAIIIPHMWNITHDPSIYENPDEFRPERFLPADGKAPELDPNEYLFGFGRRACPGQDLANAHLFITVAMILSVFTISKARNHDGVEIEPPCEFEGGTVSHPKPFPFVMEPRSEDARVLITNIDEDILRRESDGMDL